jgi:hypothetical protein
LEGEWQKLGSVQSDNKGGEKRMKKLLILVAMIALLCGTVQAQTVIYAGGQMLIEGKDTEGIGGGTMLGIGEKLGDNIYGWLTAEMFKTNEAIEADNGYVGISYISEYLVPQLQCGFFATVAGGFGKVEEEKTKFAHLLNMGFCFDLSKTKATKLWLGGGYSDSGDFGVYSIEAGISWDVNWK